MMKVITKITVLSFLSGIFLIGCGWQKEVAISGRTMGTTYHIKIITGYFNKLSGLQPKIDQRLEAINQSMSTYRPDSEISRFNAIQDINTLMHISDDFLKVMQAAQRIYELTDGAWDGTIKPLVNLWGFGNTRQPREMPASAVIKEAIRTVGFKYIRIIEKGLLQKHVETVSLDLASIAKGFAVDQISELLKAEGLDNYLVEIGGEVYAAGYRKDGSPWRVGINQPDPSASLRETYQVVPLHNRAMATSGDYRNYIEIQGRRYSHIIDPRSGYPVDNGVVSASVVAGSCMLADGLATALMVMGPQDGLGLIDSLEGVAALVIVRNPDNSLSRYTSESFDVLTQ
jgi:thiamine biosynthesis lipoprotein